MVELIKVKVENQNGILVTTSNRVAEELEVEHKNLLVKIDNYVEKFGGLSFSREFYIPSEYESRGKQYRNYLITEKGIAQLVGGYSGAVPKAFELNVAYINEFERMKNHIKSQKLPQTYKEALIELLQQVEENEKLQLKNKEQKLEIEKQGKELVHKQDIINGFTDKITLYEKRDIIQRIIKKDIPNISLRWSELYKCFTEKYHINLKVRCENYNKTRMKSKQLSTFKYAESFGYINKLYDICVKLYETDVEKELIRMGILR